MTLWLWLYVYNYDYDYNKVELPGRRLSMMATEFYDYSLRPAIRSIHSIAIPKLLLTGGAPVPWPTWRWIISQSLAHPSPLNVYTVLSLWSSEPTAFNQCSKEPTVRSCAHPSAWPVGAWGGGSGSGVRPLSGRVFGCGIPSPGRGLWSATSNCCWTSWPNLSESLRLSSAGNRPIKQDAR